MPPLSRKGISRKRFPARRSIFFRRDIFIVVGLAILTIAFARMVAFGWTNPGQNPPGGNVPPPLNSGGTSQTKTGTLNVGTLNATSSVCIGGDCKSSWSEVASVPANMIAFFPDSACPSGWEEYTTARGRYIVGLPLSGGVAATVGTALSNGENRASGQHGHNVTDPGHNHTQNAHNHSISDPGHNHTQNAHSHTASTGGAGSHDHSAADKGWYGDGLAGQPNPRRLLFDFDTADGVSVGITSAGNHTHSVTVDNTTATNNANTTGITVSNTTPTNNSNTTGITVNTTGTVTGTNAPYVQLIACRKS
jgi:hypothetical protein